MIEPQQRKSVWRVLWKTKGSRESRPVLPATIEISEVTFVGTRELGPHFTRPDLHLDLLHRPNEPLLLEN